MFRDPTRHRRWRFCNRCRKVAIPITAWWCSFCEYECAEDRRRERVSVDIARLSDDCTEVVEVAEDNTRRFVEAILPVVDAELRKTTKNNNER